MHMGNRMSRVGRRLRLHLGMPAGCPCSGRMSCLANGGAAEPRVACSIADPLIRGHR